MKILYVEDEISHVELAQRTLEDNLKGKFVLLHCDSYLGALKLLGEELDFDIVLSDLRLPDGSGLDLLKRIRETPSPPAVVLVTGQGDEQVAVAALKAGAADYLVKQSDYLHRLPIVLTNAVAQNNLAREQAAKREAEVKYQYLVEQIPAVVFLDGVDEHETTLYINPRVEELTGYPFEEWRSDQRVWENNIHPDDKDRILELDKITHAQGIPFQDEYRFIRRDGRVIWIKEDTNLIRDSEGNPLYWQGILIDITKEKENEDALQRQLKELTVLNAVTAAGTESSSEHEIIERFVQISSIIYNEVCGVLLLNSQGDTLTPHLSYYGANVSNWQFGTPITEGVTGKCVTKERAIRLGDVTKEPAYIEIATGIKSELCVPVKVNRRIIGVFNVESRKPDAFDAEDEQFLTTVAGSLGTALERLRLFRQEQIRAKELNALYQATKTLSLNLKPDIIAKSLLEIMDSLLGYEYASIYLLDEQENLLVPLTISPKSDSLEIYDRELEALYTEKRSLEQGIIGWVAQHGQAIRSGDVSTEERYLPVIKNIRSELCVPIIIRERVIGAVNIETTTSDAYSERDENLLTALANSAAIALENARLYETERARREEAETLRLATASLSVHIEIKPLLDQILSSLISIVRYDSASIFLEDMNGEMEIAAAVGFPEKFHIIGKRVSKSAKWQELISSRKALIIPDAQKDARFEQWAGSEHIHGWMGIPLIAHDKVIGFINLDSRTVNAFSEQDATLAQTFANSAAVAIQNAYLFNAEREQLKREASLLELMRVTTSSLELDQVMQTILDHMVNLIPSDSGTIQLLEDGNLRITAVHGFEMNTLVLGQTLNLQDSPIKQRALEATQPVWVNNTHVDSEYRFFEGAGKVNSFMAIPLVYKGDAIGIATLDSHTENRYTPEDADFAFAIANQAAIAIGNARLYQEALRASERRAVLHRISQDIVRFTQDPEQVYKAIHEATEKLMPCDVFIIAIRNEATNENVYVYTMESGSRHTLIKKAAHEGLAGRVINTGESVIIRDDVGIDAGGFTHFGSPTQVCSVVAVPMRIGDKVTGMISAQSYKFNAYGDEEQALLEMLATHAATAIENTRLYNETQRRLREMETIDRVSSALRLTQSQTQMYNILLDETLNILDTKHASVWIYKPSTNFLVIRAARGFDENEKHRQLKPDEGIVGRVFSTGEVHISSELKTDPYIFEGDRDSILEGYGGAAIPIQSYDGILGVLTVKLESNRQVADHINLLKTLAEIAGNSIHRADLFDQSQEQVRRLTTLRDIDAAISSSTDLRVTLNILTDHTLKHLKVDAVDILIYHPELQSLTFLCSAGFNVPSPSRPLTRIGEGLAGQVVMNGRIEQIRDLNEAGGEGRRDPLIIREGFVSYIGVPLVVKGQIKGVFEIFHRSPLSPDIDWMQFMQTLAGQAAIAIDNSQLFDNLQRSNQELKQAYDTTLEGWAHALELRDRETEGHARRVTELTIKLARYFGIVEDELENIYRGVLLHDIGKMGVPDNILRKTGALTDQEWVEMRKHPQYAYDLLSPIPYLRPALDIPYCHHEHWDGSGYPRGLKGEQIPLSARLFAVVDIWDALLSDRPYRKAWPREKVLKYLEEVAGTILDPKIGMIFLSMIEEDESKTG